MTVRLRSWLIGVSGKVRIADKRYLYWIMASGVMRREALIQEWIGLGMDRARECGLAKAV